MRKYIAIRSGPACKRGDWFINEAEGEPVFLCRMDEGGVLRQISRVPIPFAQIAAYVVEPGFQIPRRAANVRSLNEQHVVDKIDEFQSDMEETFDAELERRGREEHSRTLSDKHDEAAIYLPEGFDPKRVPERGPEDSGDHDSGGGSGPE